jgi:transposase
MRAQRQPNGYGARCVKESASFLFSLLYMKKLLKQVVGIDVGIKELVVSIGRMHDDLVPEVYGHHNFANTTKGFEALVAWVDKRSESLMPVAFVVEATGVYHEKLTYFLHERAKGIHIVLSTKISAYHRTLDIVTETDKTASETITKFGLIRKLQPWERPKPIFKKLQQLTRERGQLIHSRTQLKNKLHAEESEAEPNAGSISRLNRQMEFLNTQKEEIEGEVRSLLDSDEIVKGTVGNICSIPGIGQLTAVVVLAETNGFELIRNIRQLASYAGFDIKEKVSGTSVRRRPKISKRGNRYLRKAMHFPAMTAIQYDNKFKLLFDRLVAKHGIKMKAIVAVGRKQLELMYVLFKRGTVYEEKKQ